MAGDIIIPKKTLKNFMLGMAVACIVVLGVGATIAATVFNAGGGTIANLGAPTASSDSATKGYVDTTTGRTKCTPYEGSHSTTTSSTTTLCTGCTGRILGMYVYHTAASGAGNCYLRVDGVQGGVIGAVTGTDDLTATRYVMEGSFDTNITMTVTDSTTGTTYCYVQYCRYT